MISGHAKTITCFLLARQVIHFYFVHTDGDDGDGATSAENIHKVVERMIGIPIHRKLVDFTGTSLRGAYERYSDHVRIYVRVSQSEEWRRFTHVKELCHALMDLTEEYSVDALQTIYDLLEHEGKSILDSEISPVARSESMAELFALELIYPLEYRAKDRESRTAGESVRSISARRGVPVFWVERALGSHLEACAALWKALPSEGVQNTLPR